MNNSDILFLFVMPLTIMVLALGSLRLQWNVNRLRTLVATGTAKPANPFELPKLLSETPPTVISPHATMLRLVFNIYWRDASPSAEIFFLSGQSLSLTLTGIARMETDVIALMQGHIASDRPREAVYLGSSNVLLTGDDIATAGWKLLQN
jgi:hypothetical protein